MRVVLDTNILVSALLKPASVPEQILESFRLGQFTLLVDHRMITEYREVLRRPKLKIDECLVDEVMSYVDRFGEYVAAKPISFEINDKDDLPFVEVALSGKADALVTGNVKDFQKATKVVKILTARQFLDLLHNPLQ